MTGIWIVVLSFAGAIGFVAMVCFDALRVPGRVVLWGASAGLGLAIAANVSTETSTTPAVAATVLALGVVAGLLTAAMLDHAASEL